MCVSAILLANTSHVDAVYIIMTLYIQDVNALRSSHSFQSHGGGSEGILCKNKLGSSLFAVVEPESQVEIDKICFYFYPLPTNFTYYSH